MKKRLAAVLILVLAISVAACSTGEHKAADKTGLISEKEAKAIVLEQARAKEDDEREVELVS